MTSELEAILKAGELRDGDRLFMPHSAYQLELREDVRRLRAALRVAVEIIESDTPLRMVSIHVGAVLAALKGEA